ncbi:ABSCISIC ACID-INSENSITIVE 5-like protein 4 isoform X3 [Brassica napus]|uniref:ABSCISIC ACID-INSENSITIVE 5-like protein 4 isoform X2 n=1 Tax=Brassica oleracea var. oleracea TaxID=109376 RepID=UPI0006A6FF51|nr:PREDICTED: ABSCISIC ACID-INSENSITIVE 5-like protein 4 isoform X2 [Brassica oleracea var. oleracea]XP_048617640.1 ABSCISIC ACID-INSENSITIVE 5-like protein 4 isoform X3 [Brassica napus]
MGTHINFNSLGVDSSGGNGSDNNQSKPLGRQSSLYSLTFDELQSTLGEPGKEFGSMNMDELLKNIWTAEETTQPIMTTTSSIASVQQPSSGFAPGGGGLVQRQGSLTLPRTLSQKTVDEVWKHLMSKDSCNGRDAPERQETLGEMTLEDFLLRAGVVKEDVNCSQQNQNNCVSTGVGIGFGQPNQNNIWFKGNNSSMILNQAQQPHQQQLQQPHQRLPPTIYPKHANVTFSAPVMGKVGGRRSNTGVVEKVVERRQKRMIKNRESAARSRARKQAYTLELEAEIENLKQLNQDLQRKQAEIMKTQKNEEPSKQRPWLAKTQCLRRTLTGPW